MSPTIYYTGSEVIWACSRIFWAVDYQLSGQDYQKLRQLQKNTKLSSRRYRKVTVLVILHQGFSVNVVQAWIRKRQDFAINCNSGRKRVNTTGAVRATKRSTWSTMSPTP